MKSKVNKKNFNNYKRKQNKRDSNQNRRINNLERKFRNIGNNKINFVMPYQPRYDYSNLVNNIKTYINAILFPERYIDSGVKLPSAVGTYSYCYGFMEQFDFPIAPDGTFKLIWYPNFFSAATQIINGLSVNGATSITTTEGDNAGTYEAFGTKRFIYNNTTDQSEWKFPANHLYYTPIEGYRLVSASILIRYVGKNIDKAGYIMSIPTYRVLPAYAAFTEKGATSSGKILFQNGTFTNFDEQVFINTRGQKTSYTLNKNMTMKRVYVPLDPADSIFEDAGYYYSSAIGSNQSPKTVTTFLAAVQQQYCDAATLSDNTIPQYVRKLLPEDGNPLKYMFLGKCFSNTNGTSNIHVEAYYNFECIPTEGRRIPNNEAGGKEKVPEVIKEAVVNKIGQAVSLGNEQSVNPDTLAREVLTGFTKNYDQTGIEIITNSLNNARKYYLSKNNNSDYWSTGVVNRDIQKIRNRAKFNNSKLGKLVNFFKPAVYKKKYVF
jgi:hypothetical protein